MTRLAEKSAAASETPAISVTAASTRASSRRCHGMCGAAAGSAAERDSESCIDDVDAACREPARLVNDVNLAREPLQQSHPCAPGEAAIVEGERPRVVVEAFSAGDRRDRAQCAAVNRKVDIAALRAHTVERGAENPLAAHLQAAADPSAVEACERRVPMRE